MGEPARLLDEGAVRRVLADELAPKRIDDVIARVRAIEAGPARSVRRLTEAEIAERVERSLARRGR